MPAKSVTTNAFHILVDPATASTKRIAWAFGCAKKDSDEERQLFLILRDRFATLARERAAHDATA